MRFTRTRLPPTPTRADVALAGPVTRGVVERELRDPRAATRAVRSVARGLPMVAEFDAETAVRDAYLANVTVYACVRATAQRIAACPWRVGARPPRNYADPGDYRTDLPFARLLSPPPGGPNKTTTGRRLLAWSIAQRLVTGRFAWELELADDDAGTPVGFWPLPSRLVHPVPTNGGADYFERYLIGSPGQPGGRQELTPEQVLYSWSPSQHDWREPESPLQAARLDVAVAIMAGRYEYAFLRNDARPATVVVTSAFAEEEDYNAFRAQFLGQYGGPDNAGRTAFLEADEGDASGALDVKVLGTTQRDQQAAERAEQMVRRITVAFGTPLSVIGDASGRTFDNAGQEAAHWYEGTLLPLMQDVQDDLNLALAPRLGGDVGWFDLSGVAALRPAPKWQGVGLPALVDSGIVSRAWAAQEVGAPTEGLSTVPIVSVQPGQGWTDDDDLPPPAPAPTGALEAGASAPVTPAPVSPSPAVPDAVPAGEARDPIEERIALVEQRRALALELEETAVERHERRMQRALRRHFAKQRAHALRSLEGKRGRQLLARLEQEARGEHPLETRGAGDTLLGDPAFWHGELVALTLDLFEGLTEAALDDLRAALGDLPPLTTPEQVLELVETRANQLAGPVTETTYRSITASLAEGVENGEGIEELADRVRHVFTIADTTRAERIARTEVLSAYNGASTFGAIQAGPDVVAGREWVAARDARTREDHVEADGQVRGMLDPFVVGGARLAFPGDPNGPAEQVIQCRCTVVYLTPEDARARTYRAPTDLEPLGRLLVADDVARSALRLMHARALTPDECRTRLAPTARQETPA